MEKRRWLLAEMHCHSTNSDGRLTPEKIVALYEEKGYDVLAITDHDVLTGVSSDKMVIIPGCEWSVGTLSHLLIYFLKEMPASLDDAVSQGALICVAHPVFWPWWKKIPPQVIGCEAFNDRFDRLIRKFKTIWKIANKIVLSRCGRLYKVRVAGGDAHWKNDYAKVKFWIWACSDLEDIKQALLAGRVRIE